MPTIVDRCQKPRISGVVGVACHVDGMSLIVEDGTSYANKSCCPGYRFVPAASSPSWQGNLIRGDIFIPETSMDNTELDGEQLPIDLRFGSPAGSEEQQFRESNWEQGAEWFAYRIAAGCLAVGSIV